MPSPPPLAFFSKLLTVCSAFAGRICCGSDGSGCPTAGDTILPPSTCNPACAVAMHSFAATCGLTVTAVLGAENDFNHELQGFEQQCLENADPRVFLDAIMSADCSEAQGGAHPD